jgi:AraC-like DNA-binding protein
MVGMAADSYIQCRVTSEMKARVRALAAQRQLSESGLLKRLLDMTLTGAGELSAGDGDRARKANRSVRLYVRLRPEDQLLLAERAGARGMAGATYVSVLVRSHLRNLPPLPKGELVALKRSVAELGAIGRNLNQIARIANESGRVSGPSRDDLRAMLKVSEGLRDHVKGLIKVNVDSWECGYESRL